MFRKTFTMPDQQEFARLSGDFNKLHLDEIAARRFMFGKPVVHGIHMVLWAINNWAKKEDRKIGLTSLEAHFKRALPVDREIEYRLVRGDGSGFRIDLADSERVYTVIEAGWKYLDGPAEAEPKNKLPERKESRVLSASEIGQAHGVIELCAERQTITRLFPDLARVLPLIQISQIMATTRMVGMECPGENSIYSDFKIEFKENVTASKLLEYQVASFDERFSKFTIETKGPSMRGLIGAFLRPKPREQKAFKEIRKSIKPGEFKGQRALIIGGTRGLGEVAAKILAAGSAEIMLTYYRGKEDAQRVAEEISAGGESQAAYCYFNSLATEHEQIDDLISYDPTHLYYFATPFINSGGRRFSVQLFKEYCEYYVAGFAGILDLLLEKASVLQKVFYPSSVFVDELPAAFGEYAVAKSAGEALCSLYEQKNEQLSIYRPKLPKMMTDQTVSVYSAEQNGDPLPVMLTQMRQFNAYERSSSVMRGQRNK